MDGRGLRGDRTRTAVAHQAAALASVHGLAGMTLAQVADALEVSKSSVQAAFPTKLDLQLAAVAAATEIFVAKVIAPAQAFPAGIERLRALVDQWLAYVEERIFPGGCFLGATTPEFDSRPGPVRDALARARNNWLSTLERQISLAQASGTVAETPSAPSLAFEIDALLSAANVWRNLDDDTIHLRTARELIELRLTPAPDADQN